MVEKISVTTFAVLLVIVMLVSIIGTAYVLTTLGLVKFPAREGKAYGIVTVNVVLPENLTTQKPIVEIASQSTTS